MYEPPPQGLPVKIRFTLNGTSPLLMHNQRLSDPLDPFAKSLKVISGKKKKTDEDHEAMARIEFEGGLYHREEIGPYIPGVNIHRSLVEGARITRRGKDIDRGLTIDTGSECCRLEYSGPRDIEGLYSRPQDYVSRLSVVVGRVRVMRTRPIFRQWSLTCDTEIDTGQLNFDDVRDIAEAAGKMAGIGDYRPSSPHGGPYGRYEVLVERL